MKKKSVKPRTLIDIQCPVCGRVTHHYLNKVTGEYKCVICQNVSRTIKVKEVLFEMDKELDSSLNPTIESDEVQLDEVHNEPEE